MVRRAPYWCLPRAAVWLGPPMEMITVCLSYKSIQYTNETQAGSCTTCCINQWCSAIFCSIRDLSVTVQADVRYRTIGCLATTNISVWFSKLGPLPMKDLSEFHLPWKNDIDKQCLHIWLVFSSSCWLKQVKHLHRVCVMECRLCAERGEVF